MLLFCTKRVLHGTLPWVHYLNAVTGIKVIVYLAQYALAYRCGQLRGLGKRSVVMSMSLAQ